MSRQDQSGTAPPGQPRIVFLHIVKTAGTSLVGHFRKSLPRGQVFSHGDFMQFPQDRPLPREVFDRYRFLSGHFGYTHIAPYLDESYSFTFLRDPVARVLSFYTFCLHEDMQRKFAVARAAVQLGLEGFLESDLPEVAEMLDNQQTWQLARMYWQADRNVLRTLRDEDLLGLASEHIHRFSRVGFTETFDEDFAAILGDLGMPSPAVVPRHFETANPVVAGMLPQSVLERLRERMSLDQALYERTRAARTAPG
jgi:hypothetical protein